MCKNKENCDNCKSGSEKNCKQCDSPNAHHMESAFRHDRIDNEQCLYNDEQCEVDCPYCNPDKKDDTYDWRVNSESD